MYIHAHTHANYRWSYRKAWLCPQGFVGRTDPPFLIPGNTELYKENGFSCSFLHPTPDIKNGYSLLWKALNRLYKINWVTKCELSTTCSKRKWSQKPHGEKNFYPLHTHHNSCKERTWGWKLKLLHQHSARWPFSFLHWFFRVEKTEK